MDLRRDDPFKSGEGIRCSELADMMGGIVVTLRVVTLPQPLLSAGKFPLSSHSLHTSPFWAKGQSTLGRRKGITTPSPLLQPSDMVWRGWRSGQSEQAATAQARDCPGHLFV